MTECYGCGKVHADVCEPTGSDVLIPVLGLGIPALFFIVLVVSQIMEWSK